MKTMKEIREILCEEIDNLRSKKTTPANVNAIVNATGKILTTVKMEIEYAKLSNRTFNSSFIQLEDSKEAPEKKIKPGKDQ